MEVLGGEAEFLWKGRQVAGPCDFSVLLGGFYLFLMLLLIDVRENWLLKYTRNLLLFGWLFSGLSPNVLSGQKTCWLSDKTGK